MNSCPPTGWVKPDLLETLSAKFAFDTGIVALPGWVELDLLEMEVEIGGQRSEE